MNGFTTMASWDAPENDWDTGTSAKEAKDCSFCGERKVTIQLTPKVLGVVRKLCEDIKVEWQMLLRGTVTDDLVLVNDYYIPHQEVGSASVTNLDCIDKTRIDELGIVATIHSHAEMGVFFSSTDEQYTNSSLIKYHIVCNNAGEFKATGRINLPCGMMKYLDARVTPSYTMAQKVKGFEKIKKQEPYVYQYSLPAYYNRQDDSLWGFGKHAYKGEETI